MKVNGARLLVVLVASAVTLGTLLGVAAQDDLGDVNAAIYAGTCPDAIAEDVIFDLGDVEAPDATDEDNEIVNLLTETAVLHGDEEIDATFEELGNDDHVILVQQGQGLVAPLACGEVIGVAADGELAIALEYIDGSGNAGVAVFQELADDSASTESDDDDAASSRLAVEVYYIPFAEAEASPAAPLQPEATPIG